VARYRRNTYHFGEPGGRCHDCGIKHGGVHHFGCDVERCPICGGQMLSCECMPRPDQDVYVQCIPEALLKDLGVIEPVQPVAM